MRTKVSAESLLRPAISIACQDRSIYILVSDVSKTDLRVISQPITLATMSINDAVKQFVRVLTKYTLFTSSFEKVAPPAPLVAALMTVWAKPRRPPPPPACPTVFASSERILSMSPCRKALPEMVDDGGNYSVLNRKMY